MNTIWTLLVYKDGSEKIKAYDQIGELEGMHILHRENELTVFGDACHSYALKRILGASFDSSQFYAEFPNDPLDYLTRNNFQRIEHPQADALVVYGEYSEAGGLQTMLSHYGVMRQDGSVDSKWDQGHVYNHPLEAVPVQYGSFVWFFAFQA